MGFLDKVNDQDTSIPVRAEYLNSREDYGFTAIVRDVKIKKSENKKNPKMFGHELFIIEMEFVSGDHTTKEGNTSQPGDLLSVMKKLPKDGEALNAGYVLSEMADACSQISGIPRSDFRGKPSEVAAAIAQCLGDGACIDQKVYVSASAPNDEGYVHPHFERVEETTAKKAKKAS